MIVCGHSNQKTQPFELPDLPFDKAGFKPHFSTETFDYHHGRHHNAYVTNLNNLLRDKPEFTDKELEEIIHLSAKTNPAIFNNAAQVWNHTFFWNSIKPGGGGKPKGKMLEQINKDFDSYENFVSTFKEVAISQFGSGWAWLVFNDGKLQIIKTSNAETPVTSQGTEPIIACDVWEHAYYIDYRNKRPDYVTAFVEHMINWEFAELHLNKALGK